MAALMSSVLDRGDKLAEYALECARQGIRVFPPSVQDGQVGFSVTSDGIRFGLLAVKGVGQKFLEYVIAERERRPFSDFADFVDRMNGRDLNRRQVEALIRCGAFDFFGETRRTLIGACEVLIAAAQQKARTTLSGQIDFFSFGGAEVAPPPEYPRLEEFSRQDLISFEKEYIGMAFSGNPLDDYSEDEGKTPHTDLIEFRRPDDEDEEQDGYATGTEKRTVSVLGVVSASTEKETRSGERMAFVTLSDRTGEIELLVFPRQYRQYASLLRPGSGIAVTGELSEREGEGPKLIPQSLRALRKNGEPEPEKEKKLYLRVPALASLETERAKNAIDRVPGDVQVVFYDLSTKKYSAYLGHGVTLHDGLLDSLREILGDSSVVVF